jgi:hypothetical protein
VWEGARLDNPQMNLGSWKVQATRGCKHMREDERDLFSKSISVSLLCYRKEHLVCLCEDIPLMLELQATIHARDPGFIHGKILLSPRHPNFHMYRELSSANVFC